MGTPKADGPLTPEVLNLPERPYTPERETATYWVYCLAGTVLRVGAQILT